MEHKLIQGGEIYLPFARSRIKALWATGQKYATQKFVFPDAEVKVQISGDQHYIWITGTGCSFHMDSGIVDLKAISAAAPLGFRSGTLGNTTSTTTYNADFTTPDKTGRWRLNPNGVSQGQFSGSVTHNGTYQGKVPLTGTTAYSFMAKQKALDTDPVTYEDTTDDIALLTKKNTVSKCPASIFTGKTRLYVQALYGRWIRNSLVADANEFPALDESTAPPSLKVPSRSVDGIPYLAVQLTTNSGIFLDAAGKHWLMNPTAAGVTVYPLISSECGEKARASLVADGLSSEDKEHLEAYILAYCRPDVSKEVVAMFTTPIAFSTYSMGYGWHWNWSGTVADVVSTTQFAQPSISGISYSANTSTHHRLAVTKNASGVWSAAVSVVEGPTNWAVHRAYWTITEPSWGAMTETKTTPRNSTLFECNAPFYVFYARDTLTVCRVKVSLVPSAAAVRTMSYGFASAGYMAAIDELTCGTLDGFVNDRTATSAYYKATFSCGDLVYSDLEMPYATTDAVITQKKTGYTLPPTNFNNTTGFGTSTFEYGYPAGWDGGPYLSISIALSFPEYDGSATVYISRRAYSVSTSYSSTATLIVPFYDAEAIFAEGTRYQSALESGVTSSTHTSNSMGESRTAQVLVGSSGGSPIYAPNGPYVRWIPGYITTNLTSTNPPDSTTTMTTSLGQNLVCRAGALPATMADLGSYHDNTLEEATVNYSAWSGVKALVATVFSPTRLEPPVGVVSVPQYPALVGWV